MDTGGGRFSSSLTQFVKSGPLSGGIRGRGTGGRRWDAYRWILDIYAIVYTCAACGRDAWTAFASGPAGAGQDIRAGDAHSYRALILARLLPSGQARRGPRWISHPRARWTRPAARSRLCRDAWTALSRRAPPGAGQDIRAGDAHSYRALMFARMSLMTSEISGVVFLSFSIRSMEWSTVVWSRFSNSLPISLRERLVISRMR